MKNLSRKLIETLEPRKDPHFFPFKRGISIGVRKSDWGYSWVIRLHKPQGYSFVTFPGSISLDEIKRKALNMSVGKTTFLEAKTLYLKGAEGRVKSFKNLHDRLHLKYYSSLDPRIIQDIEAQELASWVNDLKGRLKSGTVNKLITHLKAVLNYAYRMGLVESDHAWRSLQKLRESPLYREILSSEEEIKLLQVMDDRFRYLFQFALDTGMRYSELRTLTWSNVIEVQEQFLLTDTKSDKTRVVPYRIPLPPRINDLVFPRSDGKIFSNGCQVNAMNKYCDLAGIRRIRFHDLRHTYTTREIMKGTPIQIVSKILGHSSTEITEKRYSHLVPAWYIAKYRER